MYTNGIPMCTPELYRTSFSVQPTGHTGMGQVFTFARKVVECRAGENVTTTLVEPMFLFIMTSLSRSEMMGHRMNVKYRLQVEVNETLFNLCIHDSFCANIINYFLLMSLET